MMLGHETIHTRILKTRNKIVSLFTILFQSRANRWRKTLGVLSENFAINNAKIIKKATLKITRLIEKLLLKNELTGHKQCWSLDFDIWFRVASSSLRFIQAMRCSIKCLFVTEEILCNIEREQTMTHYCTHLCWTILHSITVGYIDQGRYAKPHATGVPNS